MRFTQACRGNANETTITLHRINRRGSQVEHRLMQTAHQLVDNRSKRTGVGNLSLNALGNDLVIRRDISLEVAILRVRLASARTHRTQGAHATVALVLLAIREDDLAG